MLRNVLTPNAKPRRGDVWWADLDPARGHEQAGRRPVVIVSANRLNFGRSGLIVICPLTSAASATPLHVVIDPPEGNLPERSFALAAHVRSISVVRLGKRIGRLRPTTATLLDDRIRRVLGLGEPRVGQLT